MGIDLDFQRIKLILLQQRYSYSHFLPFIEPHITSLTTSTITRVATSPRAKAFSIS